MKALQYNLPYTNKKKITVNKLELYGYKGASVVCAHVWKMDTLSGQKQI